jgi:hypothetical protein
MRVTDLIEPYVISDTWVEVECPCLDRYRVPGGWDAFRCHTCRRLWRLTDHGWELQVRRGV